MGRREEIDAEIAKLQAEREALDGVVVIPADEYAEMLRVLVRAYDMADPDTGQALYDLNERMASYKPQPRPGGLTQEQGEQVLRWLEYMFDRPGYDRELDKAAERLASMLGHTWAAWDFSEDPRG